MSMIRTLTVAFSMLALAACDQAEPELAEPQPEATPSFRDAPSDQELKDLFCKAKRQIAVKVVAAGSCPSASGWVGTKLFNNAPGLLGKLCEYEWDPNFGSTPDVTGLAATSGLARMAPDCGAVFVQNDAIWTEIGAGIADAYRHGIGLPTAADLDLPDTESSRWKVAVAVVDTVPEPAPEDPRSNHGELMAGLINDIACPAGVTGCEVKVRRALGLPRHGEDGAKDEVRGGYYGSQRDIARAIHQAIDTWKSTNWGNEPAKLIINLSIGWDGAIFGDTSDAAPRPSVEAVYQAIETAVCEGAIVVAAAGNLNYSCNSGPLLPAAWQEHAGPDAARCQELLGDPNATSAADRPLVYSIAGLTHDRQQMVGTRLQSVSQLAALATNAVVSGHDKSVTGSSFAAAAVSGAVALVWSYNPQLSAAEVMGLLHANGDTTSVDAAYLASGVNASAVRAINICEALEAACDQPGASCPADPFATQLACIGRTAPVTPSDLLDALALAVDDTHTASTTGTKMECPNECGFGASAWRSNAYAPASCPLSSGQKLPFTLPQPNQVACPDCTLDPPNYVVYASLDADYDNPEENPVVDINIGVVDSAGAVTYFRFGDDVVLSSTSITSIVLDSTRMPSTVSSAAITITFKDERTIVDPLLIGPQ